MDKKTMDKLRDMICEELEEAAKGGSLKTHENLDVVKDLLESAKNIEKIEKYQREKEEHEMEYDRGYSQRKYFIDADYDPYGPKMSYGGRDRGMDGNSYGRSRVMYDMDGHSYGWYDPRYDMPYGGYSMTMPMGKTDMVSELHQMMNEAPDEATKKVISEAITKIGK